MPAKGTSQAERELRIRRLGTILANGGRRSDCIAYARDNWGIKEAATDNILKVVYERFRRDWDKERPQMIAELLSQCATLQMEARKQNQLHIALGAINTAARIARLVS